MAHHLFADPYNSTTVAHAWQLISNAERITLLTHRKPDGDGISACAAFDLVLHALDKKTETIYPSNPPMKLAFHAQNMHVAAHTQTPDLLIALDTASRDRLYMPEAFKDIPLINIDHHISNNILATIDIVDPQASSACEVLYNLLKMWIPAAVTKEVAERLLYGILYDTQTFHTQNTTAQTLRTSADLMDVGANLFALKTDLLSHKNPAIIKLWGDILQHINITKNGKAAWVTISQDDVKKHNLELTSLAGFVNFLSEISGIDVVAILYEGDDGKTNISLRSKKADVNAVAAHFGGGGHKNASGAVVDATLETVKGQLIEILEKL